MDNAETITARLARAEQLCLDHGAKLTDLRREVLELILAADGPLTAYVLLDRLQQTRRAAPPTIYRALDFLLQQGLIHKLERLNAFLACIDEDPLSHDHAAQFLICRVCHSVHELEDHAIAHAITHAAGAIGFKPEHTTIEIEGICAACAAAQVEA
jgi:Fur family zinc uptake transcriptional regulator